MLVSELYRRYQGWIEKHEGQINTYANHLIVIFAFSVPTLVSVRRVSITLIILLFLIRGQIIRRMITVMRDPLVASFAIYFIVHVLWLFGSDEIVTAKKAVHDASFLLFVPLFASFLDKKYIKRVAAAFVLGMVFSAVISYGMFFGMPPSWLHNGTMGTASNPTPLWHHVHYGYMLATASALILYKLLGSKIKGSRMLLGAAVFLILSINVFIIEARTGYVLYFILVMMAVVSSFKYKVLKPLIVLSVIVPVIFTVIYSSVDVFKKRVDITIASSESLVSEKNYNTSIGARVGMFLYAMDVISDNILFGNGTGDHVSEVRKYIEAASEGGIGLMMSLDHTHNEYTSSLLQFGVLGLLAFLNIPLQMMRYSSEKNGAALKIIGVSILFYSLSDVFIIGLGMILTVVTLSSVALSAYQVTDTSYSKINVQLLLNYALSVVTFYVIQSSLP